MSRLNIKVSVIHLFWPCIMKKMHVTHFSFLNKSENKIKGYFLVILWTLFLKIGYVSGLWRLTKLINIMNFILSHCSLREWHQIELVSNSGIFIKNIMYSLSCQPLQVGSFFTLMIVRCLLKGQYPVKRPMIFLIQFLVGLKSSLYLALGQPWVP